MDRAAAIATIIGTIVAVVTLVLTLQGQVKIQMPVAIELPQSPLKRLLLLLGLAFFVVPIAAWGTGGLVVGLMNLILIPSLPSTIDAIGEVEEGSDNPGLFVAALIGFFTYIILAIVNFVALLSVAGAFDTSSTTTTTVSGTTSQTSNAPATSTSSIPPTAK